MASRVVWQISAGPPSRSYANVFLACGVALIGPGDSGPWESSRDDSDFGSVLVRRFASEVTPGDIVLLRTGTATVAAVGLVASSYEYIDAFDDLNGVDAQHARRVRWYALPTLHSFSGPVFGASPPRFSRVWNEEALDFAERFLNSEPTHWQTAALPQLPKEDPPLDQLPKSLDAIVARVADLVPLFQDGNAFGEPPAEDELIAHLVVPFFHALGWPPERIAVKWKWIDVAVFSALPRTPENCLFVVETKRLGAGVEGALDQARGYATALGVPRNVIVTDGARYRMYDGSRSYEPAGYANLMRLKRPAADLFAKLQRP